MQVNYNEGIQNSSHPDLPEKAEKHLCSLQLSLPILRNRFYHGIHFHCVFKDMELLQMLAARNSTNISHTLA